MSGGELTFGEGGGVRAGLGIGDLLVGSSGGGEVVCGGLGFSFGDGFGGVEID